MTAPTFETVVLTDDAPAPARTSSQSVRKGASCRFPARAQSTPRLASTSGRAMCAQTRRTLESVRAVLEAGGAGVEDVLMFRVHLTRRDDFTG